MTTHDILLESGTNELEIIEFYLDEESGAPKPDRSFFGVNVAKVLEVIESPGLTRPSSAPHPCFLGAIPLREMILPVLDLSVWLGLTRRPSPGEVIIVTRFNKRTTGFLASGVTQIHRVGWSEVAPPHKYLRGLEDNCVTGVTEIENRFIQLLDLEKIIMEFDPAEEDAEEGGPAETGYKVLVADDSGIMRHMLEKRLTGAGFETRLAGDGQEAWNILSGYRETCEREGRPVSDFVDILISDIEMPAMDGYALTKRIKADELLSGLPVMLFSSLITDELRHKGVSVGADAQIAKPDFHMIADMARELIERPDQA